jgi:hypothetical protein
MYAAKVYGVETQINQRFEEILRGFSVCFSIKIIDLKRQILRYTGDYFLKQDELFKLKLSQFGKMLPGLICYDFADIRLKCPDFLTAYFSFFFGKNDFVLACSH